MTAWMMAASSDDDGLGAVADDPTLSGPVVGWHPARANPSSAATEAEVRGYFIMVPLAVHVLTAGPAGATRSTGLNSDPLKDPRAERQNRQTDP
jgi:hypothetical protein